MFDIHVHVYRMQSKYISNKVPANLIYYMYMLFNEKQLHVYPGVSEADKIIDTNGVINILT